MSTMASDLVTVERLAQGGVVAAILLLVSAVCLHFLCSSGTHAHKCRNWSVLCVYLIPGGLIHIVGITIAWVLLQFNSSDRQFHLCFYYHNLSAASNTLVLLATVMSLGRQTNMFRTYRPLIYAMWTTVVSGLVVIVWTNKWYSASSRKVTSWNVVFNVSSGHSDDTIIIQSSSCLTRPEDGVYGYLAEYALIYLPLVSLAGLAIWRINGDGKACKYNRGMMS
jgi:hypothetical protein